ncbi:hypothetical protein B296_00051388 [Ensete ventricosum]|uniref:Pentacotripeptide-repeat region of PRORP domain-containing protein n=1 Tax=Ensete ventricosum TaxID=4639 RepID=A0A426YDX2_ENSVE|nr:hypothetical protein B296_00051388 [Ensete ventricosum]
MKERGICPTVATYTSLVKCLASCGRLEEAEELLSEMMRDGVCPAPATYNCFFKEYRGRKDVDGATKLYKKMKEMGLTSGPDIHTYNILLGMFSKLNRMEIIREIWSDMVTSECYEQGLCLTPNLGLYRYFWKSKSENAAEHRGVIHAYLELYRSSLGYRAPVGDDAPLPVHRSDGAAVDGFDAAEAVAPQHHMGLRAPRVGACDERYKIWSIGEAAMLLTSVNNDAKKKKKTKGKEECGGGVCHAFLPLLLWLGCIGYKLEEPWRNMDYHTFIARDIGLV